MAGRPPLRVARFHLPKQCEWDLWLHLRREHEERSYWDSFWREQPLKNETLSQRISACKVADRIERFFFFRDGAKSLLSECGCATLAGSGHTRRQFPECLDAMRAAVTSQRDLTCIVVVEPAPQIFGARPPLRWLRSFPFFC